MELYTLYGVCACPCVRIRGRHKYMHVCVRIRLCHLQVPTPTTLIVIYLVARLALDALSEFAPFSKVISVIYPRANVRFSNGIGDLCLCAARTKILSRSRARSEHTHKHIYTPVTTYPSTHTDIPDTNGIKTRCTRSVGRGI